jgi:predicted RNase H-like nuclease (RuvC/YqgF family)
MSTNSIYEQDEHTLGRNATFESLNKENDPISFNSLRQPFGNNSSLSKSKSYVNAMLDLQEKVKTLERENESLKATVLTLRDEKERNMSESAILNEDLKLRLESM